VKFVSQNYYEILDVDPSATEDEVKRSYRLVRRSFEPESMAIYSLYSPEETEAIGAKIDEAFGILTNRDRRRAYDKYLRTDEVAAPIPADPDSFFDNVHDIRELVPLEEFVDEALVGPSGMYPSSGGHRVVSAEVQVEDDEPSDIESVACLELHEAPLSGSMQAVVSAEVEAVFEDISSVAEIEEVAPEPELEPVGASDPPVIVEAFDASLEHVVDGPEPVPVARPAERSLELPFEHRAEPEPEPEPIVVAAPEPVCEPEPADVAAHPVPFMRLDEPSAEDSIVSMESSPSSPRLRSWTRSLAQERRTREDSIQLSPLTPESLSEIRESGSLGVSGEALRRLREQRGIDLETICEVTKISIMHLRFIEQDCYENLPAPIYLKGFVDQYARLLKLPGEVVDGYMQHYKCAAGG